MPIRCTCPNPTYLASAITDATPCEDYTGQIQRFFFWRRDNNMSATSAITATGWTALLTATGNTKVVTSPILVGNVENEPGEAREFGGGNETKNGVPIIIGADMTSVSGRFYGEDQDNIATIKQWTCEDLDVIMVNEAGRLIYDSRSTGATLYGFPMESLFVGDLKLGGFGEPDRNEFSFKLRPDWSDTLKISAETTFALTLVNS